MKRAMYGKDVNEGLDKIKKDLGQTLREADTGMPDIASMGFAPMNLDEIDGEMDLPAELWDGWDRG